MSGTDDDPSPLKQARIDALGAREVTEFAAPADREQLLSLAEESAGIGVWQVDLATGLARGTAQFFRLYGLEPTDRPVPMEVMRAMRHPDDRESVVDGFRRALAEGLDSYEAEYRVVRPDGEVRWVFGRGRVVRDAAGRPRSYAGVDIDITQRKQAETARREAIEALARLNAELEARVEQRTAELVQLQKLETLGQLTGGIAHDFNNVLSIVLGSLRLLRKRFDHPEPAVRLIDAAIQGAQRGADLTRRLLAFARRQELASGPVDLAALVRGTADLMRRSLGPEVRIELDLPPDLPPARADASQLDVAVLNLAVNARDAMPLGGRLTIRGRSEIVPAGEAGGLAPGPYVVLEVADTGEGMDAQTLARACEPFFTTKGVGKGTGLGLAMVHGFAAQSGGALRLASRPGEGTMAAIWLPVAAGKSLPRPAPGDVSRPPQVRGGLRVLAVDDDALVLLGTVELLKDLGHEVLEAGSGEAALALLHGGARIDLVVADQAMPGMTGLELAAAIAAAWPGLPVLLATGYAELPEGVSPLPPRVTKPFSQDELAAAIDRLFAGGPGNVVRLRPS